jgi:hypothetical protein
LRIASNSWIVGFLFIVLLRTNVIVQGTLIGPYYSAWMLFVKHASNMAAILRYLCVE